MEVGVRAGCDGGQCVSVTGCGGPRGELVICSL